MIQLARDIKLTAADAAAAAAAAANATSDGDDYPDDITATAAVPNVGTLGLLLRHNLSIVGGSRGTQTRLDTDFLAAIVRLDKGVRLTLHQIELYKVWQAVMQK